MIKHHNKQIKAHLISLAFITIINLNLYSAATIIAASAGDAPIVTSKKLLSKVEAAALGSLLIQELENNNTIAAEKLIVAGANINIADQWGLTPLMCAACHGHKDIVKLLIDKGICLDSAYDDGFTALMWASTNGHKDIVKLLIDFRANIDLVDNDGNTALMEALSKDHEDIVKLLIDNGANVDTANLEGYTAIILAPALGNEDMVKLLIEAGTNIDAVTKTNRLTALIVAVRYGHKEIVELLIKSGANLDIADQHGNTAITDAYNRGNKDIFYILKNAPQKRKEAQERRKIISESLKDIKYLPKVLTEIIDSYLPIDLPSILADAEDTEKCNSKKTTLSLAMRLP